MFAGDDPSFDEARHQANLVAEYLRRHGPWEPHRLPLDEMEYTTMPAVAKKLSSRWEPLDSGTPATDLRPGRRPALSFSGGQTKITIDARL